jgi:hypothetical protein
MGLTDRLRHAWNVFIDSDSAQNRPFAGGASLGSGMMGRADRTPLRFSVEKSIISSIYTRISIDAAGIPMVHVRTDEDGRYLEDIDSGLNDCLRVEPTSIRAGVNSVKMSSTTILDEACVRSFRSIPPLSPEDSGGYDIKTLTCWSYRGLASKARSCQPLQRGTWVSVKR